MSKTALVLAFIAGGAVTAASLIFGLLPIKIEPRDQAPPSIDSNTYLQDQVISSLLDEVDASFARDDAIPPSVASESPSEAYARIVARRQARLANKVNGESIQGGQSGSDRARHLTAFAITVLQAVTLGIAFGISFLLSQSGRKLWWVFIGFVSGVVVGWPLGAISWASMLVSGSLTTVLVDGLSRSFLFAIVGAGMGGYFGRERFKNRAHSTP